jgi:hypothetical protein
MELMEKEFQSRLKSSENGTVQSIVQLNDLLAEQHQISLKWKSEALFLNRKSEEIFSAMKKELKKLKEEKSRISSKLRMKELELALLKSNLPNNEVTFASYIDNV